MKDTPRTVLVVGVGNPDRGDDGVGPLVAKILADILPTGVAIASPTGDLLNLVPAWSGFDAVICIDAAAPLTTPGRIHRFDLARTALPQWLNRASSHAVGLVEAIRLARVLQQAPSEMIVYAVEGARFAIGAPITPEVADAAVKVAGCVVAEVARLRQNSNGTFERRGPAVVDAGSFGPDSANSQR
jgi:hydrogenase maturation protease